MWEDFRKMKEDYKVDPRNIHIDQRKKDTRREAWDRDVMPADWKKSEPKSNKKMSSISDAIKYIYKVK